MIDLVLACRVGGDPVPRVSEALRGLGHVPD
jgi:hypothetical protein